MSKPDNISDYYQADVDKSAFPSVDAFRSFISDPQNAKDYFESDVKSSGSFSTIEDFENFLGVKKKDSQGVSANGTKPISPSVSPLSSKGPLKTVESAYTELGKAPLYDKPVTPETQIETPTEQSAGLPGITSEKPQPIVNEVATPDMPMDQKLNIWRKDLSAKRDEKLKSFEDISNPTYSKLNFQPSEITLQEAEKIKDPDEKLFYYKKAYEKSGDVAILDKIANENANLGRFNETYDASNEAISYYEANPDKQTKETYNAYFNRAWAGLYKGEFDQSYSDAMVATEKLSSSSDTNDWHTLSAIYGVAASAAKNSKNPEVNQTAQYWAGRSAEIKDEAYAKEGIDNRLAYLESLPKENMFERVINAPIMYGQSAIEGIGAMKESLVNQAGNQPISDAIFNGVNTAISTTMAVTPAGYAFEAVNAAAETIEVGSGIPVYKALNGMMEPVTNLTNIVFGEGSAVRSIPIAGIGSLDTKWLDLLAVLAMFKAGHTVLGKGSEPTVKQIVEARDAGEIAAKIWTRSADFTEADVAKVEKMWSEATPAEIKQSAEILREIKPDESKGKETVVVEKTELKITEETIPAIDRPIDEASKPEVAVPKDVAEVKPETMKKVVDGKVVPEVKAVEQVEAIKEVDNTKVVEEPKVATVTESAKPTENITENNEWILENSTDPIAIKQAYEAEKSNAPYDLLEPWQQQIVDGALFTRDSFINASDAANITQGLAKRFLRKEDGRFAKGGGTPIDVYIKDVLGDENITPDMVVDFLLKVDKTKGIDRKTTDLMNPLRKKYKELTGTTLNRHTEFVKKAQEEKLSAEIEEKLATFENKQEALPEFMLDEIQRNELTPENVDAWAEVANKAGFPLEPYEVEIVKKYIKDEARRENDITKELSPDNSVLSTESKGEVPEGEIPSADATVTAKIISDKQNAYDQARRDYDKAKSNLDKDISSKQLSMDKGAEMPMFDLSDKIKSVEELKKKRDIAKSELEKVQAEKQLPGQTDLFSDKAARIADVIRKGKIGEDIMMGTIPFAKEVWNGAIETIATSVEIGGKLADAINDGVKYIKKTDWYKKLDADSKELAIKKFEDNVQNIKEIKLEYKPSDPRGKKVQKDVDLATGARVEKNMITKSEKALLHDRIRNFARGVREGRKDVRDFIKEIKDEIKYDKNTDTGLRGRLNSKQISAIFNKADKVIAAKSEGLREKRMSAFVDYVEKIIANENYDVDLATGNSKKASITKKIKAKSKDAKKLASDVDVVGAFLKVKPSEVSDITRYNEVADMVNTNLDRLKAKIQEGEVVLENERREISNNEIIDYTKKELEYSEQVRIEKIKNDYEFLANENMTYEEFKEIIEAYEKGDDAAIEILDKIKEDQFEQKRKAMADFVKYRLFDLDDYSTLYRDSLSPKEQATLDSLRKIDTSQLSIPEVAKLNDIINNITLNDSFDGSTYFKGAADWQVEYPGIIGKIKKLGVDLGSLKNWFIRNVSSKDMLIENIYKSDKVSAEVKRATGIDDIYNKQSVAKNNYESTVREYNTLRNKLKIKNTPRERIEQGMYSFVRQNKGGTPTEMAKEFNRRKSWIKQSAEYLMDSGIESEKRMGEIYSEGYEKIKDARTPEEVRALIEKSSAEMSDFFVDKWDNIKSTTEESARMDNNIPFEYWNEYTATKTRGIGGVSIIEAREAIDIFKQEFFNTGINSKEARTKISRTQTNKLPEGMVVDLDFASTQFERMWETMYDNATSESIQKIKHIFGNKQYDAIFGGTANKNIVKKYIADVVNQQRGTNTPIPEIERTITTIINKAQAKGIRMALGGITQILKQPISVSANTVINMGARPDLFFKSIGDIFNTDAKELMSKHLISQRGGTQAGYDRGVQLTRIPRIELNNIRDVANKTGEVSKAIYDGTMKALTTSDVAAARVAWLSYYKKYLVENKIEFKDWKTENEKPNESAAAYAEHMVSRTQNPNDATAMARLYQEGGKGFGQVIKNIVLPFSTFQVNQRMRMTSDVKKILYGSSEVKAEAVKSLVGTIVEQAVFNSIKTYIIGAGVTAGANAILSAYGFDEQVSTGDQEKKFISNTLNDTFLSGFGSAAPKMVNKGANSIYSAITNDNNKLLYTYEPKEGTTDWGAWGVYGVTFGAISDMYNRVGLLDGKADMVTKGGLKGTEETQEVEMSQQEQNMAITNFIVDALGLVGVSDADLLRMNSKLKFVLDSEMKKKYGGETSIKIYSKPKKSKQDKYKKEVPRGGNPTRRTATRSRGGAKRT